MDKDILTDVFEYAVRVMQRRMEDDDPTSPAAEEKLVKNAISVATKMVAENRAKEVRDAASVKYMALREMLLEVLDSGFPVPTRW
jgi:hypothetical protein